MNIEELFNTTAPAGRPSIHPFAKMNVGQIVEITEEVLRMQTYAHVYGRSADKKFATRKVNGVLYVKRIS